MKKSKIITLILLGLFLLFSIWYHLPIRQTAKMPVCTLDGKTADVKINVSFHRSFFKPTVVKGALTFNGTEHHDLAHAAAEKSFFENLSGKFDEVFHGTVSDFYVYDVTNSALHVTDYTGKYNMEQLMFWYLDDDAEQDKDTDNGIAYFGPAKNAGEAKAVAFDIYKTDSIHIGGIDISR